MQRIPAFRSSLTIMLLLLSMLSACKTTKDSRNANVQTPDGCEAPTLPERTYFIQEHLVMATLWYQHASEYRAMAYQAFNLGRLQLDSKLERSRFSKPPCVVVDIDETVLNNSPYAGFQIRCGQGYSSPTWKEWTALAEADTIPGAVSFLKYAQSRNVETFYISNRKVDELDATLKNLQKFGFPYADKEHVFLRESSSDKESRRQTVLESNAIVLLFGDNLGDFADFFEGTTTGERHAEVDRNRGHFGNDFIVLPNPGYGGWEKRLYGPDKLNAVEKDSVRHARIRSFR